MPDPSAPATQPSAHSKVRMVTVEPAYAGQRIDNFLRNQLKGVPKSLIYRIIRKGEVRVNKGRIKPEYKLQAGDQVRVPPVRVAEPNAPATASGGLLRALESAILYEDKQLLVINKPSGLAVHGGSGINLGLIEALRQLRPHEQNLELVHRLDRDTSGCIMVAKKRSMLKFLHQQLRQGKNGSGIDKRYLALVCGLWPARKNRLEAPLRKNILQSGERMVRVEAEGQSSRTDYQVQERFADYSLVEARPITGRTHQIRVHCQYAGFPIAGDLKYGREDDNKRLKQVGLKRLFLHAQSLVIPLPDGAPSIRVEAPLADELQAVLATLRRRSS